MELQLNIKLNYVLLPAGAIVGAIMAVGLTSMADGPEQDTGPRVIPYNGVLEFDGQALNGQADLKFTLTDIPGGVGANCFFEEEHDNVTAYSGRFSVNIGSVANNLDSCVFDSDVMYIEVGVRDADSNGDYVSLSGSQRIHPVPYSYWAAEGSNFNVDGNIINTAVDGDDNDLPVTIGDNLDVTGNLAISGELSDSDSSLIINDDVAIYNTLNAQGAISNSTSSNGGNVFINDGLRVQNSAYVGYDGSGTLTVDGNTNLKNNIFNGGSNNSGRVYIDDGLNVKNNTTIGSDGSGTLTVNGASTINGNFTVTGTVTGILEEADYIDGTNTASIDRSGVAITRLAARATHWCFLTQTDKDADCTITQGSSNGTPIWGVQVSDNSLNGTGGTCSAICISK